ncbi:hypothetical protein [Caldilinea sp.]|uniref:hypothetical protein n=1 Tax=Caldilinea sp. TaxID=2293560 RepID=UPI002CC53DF1|nr:hypothetical protein [Caldilinea sp.]HRA68639.1 hypothetical protein [Caldilinea sp.]
MIVIDSDVLILAFAFQRDERQPINHQFLSITPPKPRGATIYSIMEVLGKLSFNLSQDQLRKWPLWLRDAYQLNIIFPAVEGQEAAGCFRREWVESPLQMMAQRIAYLDALILHLVERTPDIDVFVTWNARHFSGKTAIRVMTPAEYMTSGAEQKE